MAQGADLSFGLGHPPAPSGESAADLERLVADVLRLLADGLEVGATFLTRVDGNSVRVERVYDRSGLKLAVGDRLPLPDTSGGSLIVGSLRPLLIGPLREDLSFSSPSVKRDFGIAAYSGVLLYTSTGELYGTLGTLQAQARSLKEGEATLLTLAGRFIMHAIEAQQVEEAKAEQPVTGVEPPAIYSLQEIDPALLVDLDGQIRTFNAAAEDLLGFSADVVIGRTIMHSGIIPSGRIPAVLEALNSALVGETGTRLEIELVRSDGTAMPAEVRLAALSAEGENTGVQLTVRDLTEDRRLRNEMERLAEQERLAHEEITRLTAQRQELEEERAQLTSSLQINKDEIERLRSEAQDAVDRSAAGDQESQSELRRLTIELDAAHHEIARLQAAQEEARREIGRIQAAAQAAQDATVRLSAEEEQIAARARAFEATLRAAIDASPLPTMSLGADAIVRQWNAASTYLLGWTAEEVIGGPLPCVASETVDRIGDIVQRALRGEEVSGEEVVYQRRDGSPVWLRVTATPSFDGVGGIEGLLLTHTDESENRQLGDALRDVAARYLGVVEGAPDILFITDVAGSIAMASRLAATVHGYDSPESMVGVQLTDLVDPDDNDRAAQTLQTAVRDGRTSPGLFKLTGKNGTSYSGDARFSLLRDVQGEPAGVVVLIRDVSEQQARAEQQARSLQEAQDRAAHLATELSELQSRLADAGAETESDLNNRLAQALEEHRQAEDALRQALSQEQEARIQAEGALGELREADRDLVAMLERERAARRESEIERDALLARVEETTSEAEAELSRRLAQEHDERRRQEAELRAFLTQEQDARAQIEQSLDELRRASVEMQALLEREQGQRIRLEAERDDLLKRIQESSSQAETELARRLGEEQEEHRRNEAEWQDALSHGQQALEQVQAELSQLVETRAILEAALTQEQERRTQLETEREQLLLRAEEARSQAQTELSHLLAREQEQRQRAEAELQLALERERESRVQLEADLARIRRTEEELQAALTEERQARALLEREHQMLRSRLEEGESVPAAGLSDALGQERTARAEVEQERDRLQAQLVGTGSQSQAAERSLQSVMAVSPAAIIRYDIEGHVRGWNAASERMFGWTQAEAMGMPLPLLPNERRQEFRNLLDRVRRGESALDVPLRLRGKDTLWHEVRIFAVPLYNGEGGVSGIFAVLTETAEEEERAAAQSLRPAFDLSPDAVLQTDLQGAIVYANRRAAALLDFSTADAMLGASFLSLIAQPERERAGGLWQQWRTESREDSQPVELPLERQDGTVFPAEVSVMPVSSAERQEYLITLVIRDLSSRKQIEDALDGLRRQNEALLEASDDGIAGIDLWGRVTFVNRGLERLTGYSAEEITGQSLHQILHGGTDAIAGHTTEQCALYAVLRERTALQVQNELFRAKDASEVTVDYTATPIRQGNKLVGAMIVARPAVSQSAEASSEGRPTSQEGLSPLLADAPLPAAMTDTAGVYLDVNEAYAALLGYSRSELLGTHYFSVIPETGRDRLAVLYEQWTGARLEATDEHDVVTKDGRTLTVLETSMPLEGASDGPRRVSFLLDITARKVAEQETERAAQNDTLTDLPSLPIFHDRLIQALAYANRHGQLVGILHLDIDGFGQINEALGRNAGDLLLHEVGERLESVTRDLDTVVRLKSDDFVVILPDVGSAQNAATVARKILSAFARGFAVFGETMTVTASIGISLFPFDGTDGDALLSSAEAGMYRAKEEGGNTLVFYGAGVD